MSDFIAIQKEVIQKYHITIDSHSSCRGRMHAHIKERRVCKWKPKNSFACTFDLLHEIGHIETTTSKMRRAEEEYHATVWAIDRCREYGLDVSAQTLFTFQRYILLELARGLKRGGKDYDAESLNLFKYAGFDEITLHDVYEACDSKWKNFIGYQF